MGSRAPRRTSVVQESAIVELGFSTREWQRAVKGRLKRFTTLVVHRRAGKTVFAIVLLIHRALKSARTDGRYGYIAPQLKQAKGVAWDMLTRYARVVPGCAINESELRVDFPNGARIRLSVARWKPIHGTSLCSHSFAQRNKGPRWALIISATRECCRTPGSGACYSDQETLRKRTHPTNGSTSGNWNAPVRSLSDF